MPTSLVVANAAQMRLIWATGGALYALNVLGVVDAASVAITQALTNTLGTNIKAAVTSSGMGAQISTAVTLANIGLRDLRTANQTEFIDTAAAVAGTEVGGFLPPQTAFCVTLRTASAGARFRGRVFLPGFGEGVNTAGGVMANVALPVAFITAIKNALIAQGLDLGVIHRPVTVGPSPSAGFITTVTSIVARDGVWDTQRRRAIPGI